MPDCLAEVDATGTIGPGFSGPPIIFISYSPAHYLRWTLAISRRSNPSKRIFLLGDATNKRSVRGVAEVVDFESLGGTEKERTFQQPAGWARLEKN